MAKKKLYIADYQVYTMKQLNQECIEGDTIYEIEVVKKFKCKMNEDGEVILPKEGK